MGIYFIGILCSFYNWMGVDSTKPIAFSMIWGPRLLNKFNNFVSYGKCSKKHQKNIHFFFHCLFTLAMLKILTPINFLSPFTYPPSPLPLSTFIPFKNIFSSSFYLIIKKNISIIARYRLNVTKNVLKFLKKKSA